MKQRDLTQGSVNRTLLAFTGPFLLSSLVQTLYGIVDLLIVGRFGDTQAMAAVSISSTAMAAFSMFIIGLGVGATVVIGQRFGAGDQAGVQRAAATAFSLFPLISIGMTVILLFLAKPVLLWMNTEAAVLPGAYQYLVTCLIGLIFTCLYNTLSGILRGLGDSVKPMLFVFAAGVFNLVGDLVLVAGFHLGALGAAIATTAAQALSFLLGMLYVRRRDFVFDFRPRSFRIHQEDLRPLLGAGIPIGLQECLTMISFLILEALINKLGYVSTAAAGVLDKLFMFATIPTMAFNSSISAMAAQNIGAGKPERAKQCLWIGMGWSLLVAVVLFVPSCLCPGALVGLFTADDAVIEAGVAYFAGYKFDFLLCSVIFCLHGLFNGAGHPRFTLLNNLISTFAVRVPACWLLSLVPGATLWHLGWGLPMASLVQFLCAAVYYKTGKWQKTAKSNL